MPLQSELKANITVLQDKQQSLEKSLESIDQSNGIDVDEAVTTTAPLYKQWVSVGFSFCSRNLGQVTQLQKSLRCKFPSKYQKSEAKKNENKKSRILNTLTFYTCRLLNAYAEEAATEDAIYYMGEALRNGVIDLDLFLKQVRLLSRKQFMLRALMQKCRQKAGLAG